MTKIELFDKKLQNTAAIFKVLGHPARLAILQYVGEAKLCISGDISEELPLSRTTVNQHLKELKELKLIQGEIEGKKVNYCLNPEKLKQVGDILERFINDLDCCKSDCC
jgi:ArsR family transcriptional regulator, arsenate/arsenite/antimonite-responsive transcriptional repressor